MTILGDEDGVNTIGIGKIDSKVDEEEREFGNIYPFVDYRTSLCLNPGIEPRSLGSSWILMFLGRVDCVLPLLDALLSASEVSPLVQTSQLCLLTAFCLILVFTEIKARGRGFCATLLGSIIPRDRREDGNEWRPIQRYIIEPTTTWCQDPLLILLDHLLKEFVNDWSAKSLSKGEDEKNLSTGSCLPLVES